MGSKKSSDEKKKRKEKLKKESDSAGGAEDGRRKNGGKIITDARFSSLHSDPRFQKVPTHKTKVEIDSRFNRMFHDKSFNSSSAPLDKRGKPKKDKSGNTLSHYYRLEEQEEEEKKKGISSEEDEDEDDVEEEDENEIRKLSDSESNGESELSGAEYDSGTDATSTDIDTDEEDDGVYSEEEPSAQEENIPVIETETHRLAVVNMDWRQVKRAFFPLRKKEFLR